jgi:hypothetical protein
MKKILALILAMMMLGTACCALAEETQGAPLYKTIGDAMDAARKTVGEEGNIVAGGMIGEYVSVITEENGKYFRHLADYDEKLAELEAAKDALNFEAEDYWEKWEKASADIEAYMRTLPVTCSEEFTAEPIAQADLDALAGKTIAELTEAGYVTEMSGTEGGEIVYAMRYGIFSYNFTVDADEEVYFTASDNGTEGELAVKSGELAGISDSAWDKRFHTDGTVEEEQALDLMSEMPPEAAALMNVVMEIAEAAKNGEEVDIDKLFDAIGEQFPDKKDAIEPYREMIKQMDPEMLQQMLTPQE